MANWVYDRPHHWKCSECKAMWTDMAKDFFRYCPTCGAKMENVTYADDIAFYNDHAR